MTTFSPDISSAPRGKTEDGWQDSQAVFDVAAERRRQVEAEGWAPAHDDQHTDGSMARAGACYAYEASRTDNQRQQDIGNPPIAWPWADEWWKSTTRRRDLVKAAALIIAEIERLDRIAQSDVGAVAEMKGSARLANADSVEPSASGLIQTKHIFLDDCGSGA